MNWKKFLISTGLTAAIGLATAYGLAWAPVILIAKADIFTWVAEVGIACAGLWGIKKTWQKAIEKKQPNMQFIPPMDVKSSQQENQKEYGSRQVERPHGRFGFRAPKLIAKWRSKKMQQKQNYRDAA